MTDPKWAIKVQYPGIRASIDSDVNNIATLLRLPGLLPRGRNIAPLLAATKQQLHEEADYPAKATNLLQYRDFLEGSATFVVPDLHRDFSTGQVLAMTYMLRNSLDSLTGAPHELRDRAAAALIDLVLRELFSFYAMQTGPNLANYRIEPATGRLVLLDCGAVRSIDPGLSASFLALLNAGQYDDADLIRSTMLQIGHFGPATAPKHQALIQRMFKAAIAPLRQDTPFDFGQSDLLERLRDMGLAIGRDRDLMHVPPAETLSLHRKIGGMYLLATKLRAKVDLPALVENYR